MRSFTLLTGMVTVVLCAYGVRAEEAPHIYGIHDASPVPQPWLDRLAAGGTRGFVTATVAVGHNPTHTGGDDFRAISNQGHTVICRINNGYCPDGTIPVPSQYDNFATRVANYVKNTQGCDIFVIGNETNLAVEWPLRESPTMVTPQMYADCFVKCYNKIKQVRPDAKVVSQALAPWAMQFGPGSLCGFPHDGLSMSHLDYLNVMLSAIRGAGAGPDGIALHINSRGYAYSDVHNEHQVYFGGKYHYWSFYVYKDWINYGIPTDLYHLPLYATECNGVYYWNGGYPECTDNNNPSCSYQSGWIEWIYEEIDNWNRTQGPLGKPVFHCVNMYRWPQADAWNIDGSPKEAQILADLSDAVAHKYRWDAGIVVEHGYYCDFDEDDDVDQQDFGFLQGCFTGNGETISDPACEAANFDDDGDVDIADFNFFQSCMSGADVLPPQSCYY